jgi:fibronectin-binding autotransporter adhesin
MKTLSRIAMVSGLALSASAHGQVFNWAAAISGNWSDAGNWTGPGGIPNSTTADVFVLADALDYDLFLNLNVNVNTFRLDSSRATFQSSFRSMTVQTLADLRQGRTVFTGGGFNGPGGLINRATFDAIGTVDISTSSFTQEGQLNILATGSFNSTLSRTGAMSNTGTISMISTAATASTLSVSGTLTNNGFLNSEVGAGGGRFLSVDELVNNGQISINADTTFNSTSSTLTNEGTLTIAAGKTLTFSGSGTLAFNQNAGTLVNNGQLAVLGERFNFAGPGPITGNRVLMQGGTLNITGLASGGFDAVGAVAFEGNVASGQRIDILATGSFNSALNAAAGFSSRGTINLTSTAATSSTLSSSGTVINDTGGTISVEPGSGGGRFLTMNAFENKGTLFVGANTTFNQTSSTLTNTGQINIAAGSQLTFAGSGDLKFNQNGGSLNNSGSFLSVGETFNVNGGAISGNDLAIQGGAFNVNNPSVPFGAEFFGTVSYGGDMGPAQRIDVFANGSFNTVLNAGTGFTSRGTINLFSSSSTFSTLSVNGTFTNDAGGILNVQLGSGGGRFITTNELINRGTINVDANASFNQTSGILTNEGSLNIAPGTTLNFSGSGTLAFNQNGGSLNNSGTFLSVGETFNVNGGAISGNDLAIQGGAFNVSNPSVAFGAEFFGTVGYSGDMGPAQRIDVFANGSFNTVLNAGAGFTSRGTINLFSSSSTFSTLSVNGTFTNDAGGILNVQLGSGGGRFITTNELINRGTINVDANASFNQTSGILTNEGSLNIAPGITLNFSGSGTLAFNHNAGTINNNGSLDSSGESFNFNGGTIAGNFVNIIGGSLHIVSLGAGGFNVNGLVNFSGAVASAQRIDVIGTGSFNSTLHAPAGFSNGGTMNLTSTAATFATLTADGPSTNGGVINVLPGAGGARSMTIADFTNLGTYNVNAPMLWNATSATYLNLGNLNVNSTLTIAGSGTTAFTNHLGGVVGGVGTLDISGVEQFTNFGVFAPGNSAGTLTVTNRWSQSAAGSLQIEIGGTASGESDLLSILGSASLDGSLVVSLINGFQPGPADSFIVLDGFSLTGTFSNASTQVFVLGGGQFDVIYNASAGTVTLTNYIPAPGAMGTMLMAGLVAFRRRR